MQNRFMSYQFNKIKSKVILILSIMSIFCVGQASADVSIIVHPDNTSSFDEETIKKIFLGKTKSFSNGRSVILISVSSSDPTTDEFNEKVLGRSSSQIKAYWSKILFTGKGTPPQEMNSNSDVVSAVSSNPDAIGFIDSSAATSSVKVIETFK